MPRIKRMLPAPLSVCIHLRDNLWRDERGGILILFVVILMVCVASDPFIRFTGLVSGLRLNQSGQYVLTSQSIFVNEPE